MMIFVTARPFIKGYRVTAYKGTVQGATFDEMVQHARHLRANAILNTCFDDALGIDTIYHGAAAVTERISTPSPPSAGGDRPVFVTPSRIGTNEGPK